MEQKEARENITRIFVLLAVALAGLSLVLNLLTMWLERQNHPQGKQDDFYQESSIAANIMLAGQVDHVSDGMEPDISLLVESVPNYDYAVFKQRTLVPSEGDTLSADALAWVGFDAVCLADEHALDYGKEGVEDYQIKVPKVL